MEFWFVSIIKGEQSFNFPRAISN